VFAVVISEKGGAERREVFEGSEVTVGRVRGNDLVLSKGNVSKRHARLTQKDGRFVVVDQNSTNGTYVNRQRIVQATIVREGDRIYIGDFILRIEDAGGAHATSDEGAARAENETIDQPGWAAPPADELKAPQVPAVPRVPAPLSRVPRRPAEASEPDVGRPPKTESTARQDSSPIESVRVLVERVTEKVERRTLERDIADNVARRIERVLLEELARLRDEKGISPQLTDEQLVVAARAELVGLGPLEALIRNPNATQLTANGTRSVSIVQGERLNYATLPFSSVDSLERVLARLCRMSEASHDGRETFMTGRLAGGIIWKAVRQRAAPEGIVLVVRRRANIEGNLEELVRDRVLSKAMSTFLTQCMSARVNVLVVGSRQPSVARVSSALSEAAVDRQLLILEEHYQLAANAASAIRLDANTAALDPSRLIDFARSMPETNLVVEGLAGRTLLAVMEIIVHGFNGVVAGVNSTTVEQAIARLSTNFASLNPGVSVDTARQAIISGFDLALEVGASPDGRDRVRRVVDLSVTSNGATQLQDIFSFVTDRAGSASTSEGTFLAAHGEPRLLDELRARGVAIDTAPFQRNTSP
jgi:pilus assembly protein CpaF